MNNKAMQTAKVKTFEILPEHAYLLINLNGSDLSNQFVGGIMKLWICGLILLAVVSGASLAECNPQTITDESAPNCVLVVVSPSLVFSKNTEFFNVCAIYQLDTVSHAEKYFIGMAKFRSSGIIPRKIDDFILPLETPPKHYFRDEYFPRRLSARVTPHAMDFAEIDESFFRSIYEQNRRSEIQVVMAGQGFDFDMKDQRCLAMFYSVARSERANHIH